MKYKLLLTSLLFILSTSLSAIEARYFESVKAMTEDTTLVMGDVAITKGFYRANDGGGATYNIIDMPSNLLLHPADGWSLIKLAPKGLFADLLLGDEVSICQLGAIPVKTLRTWATGHESNTHDDPNFRDCHDNLMAYINLCKRKNKIYQLNCPSGHFFTSPAYLVIGQDKGVRIRGASPKDYGHHNETVFHAWERGQDYIWTISGAEQLCHKNYPYVQASGVNITNISFSGQHGGGNYPQNQYSPIVALISVGMCNSNFDSLNFEYIGGSAMVLCNTQETYFGFVSVTSCGAFYKGSVMPCIWYAQIMGKNGFARKVLGRTDEDYVKYESRRNCSANYYNYINAEGIGGSIIHADRGATFTHSEIGNIQWEGSFADFSNMRNKGYDHIKADGQKDYSFDENTRAEEYPNEKVVLCGAFSGWGHDITIHAITHTWNPMGYLAWYGDTMYRVRKAAAIVLTKESMNKYCNVHLIDYNYRQDFPVCWIEKPEEGVLHERVFSLDTPIPANSKIIRCYNGTPLPGINISGTLPQDVFYPGTSSKSYLCCHYDKDATAPAHLTAYSTSKDGNFTMTYRANKHYFARIKPRGLLLNPGDKQGLYVGVYVTYKESGQNKNMLLKCKAKRYGEFTYINLDFGKTKIDDNSPLKIWMGGLGGSTPAIWDCIKEMDNTPIYSTSAPVSDYNWVGRLWYDTSKNKMIKCVATKHPALYKITVTGIQQAKPGTLTLSLEGNMIDLSLSDAEFKACNDNASLAKTIAQKLKSEKYAAVAENNTIYLSGKKAGSTAAPTFNENKTHCELKIEVWKQAVAKDEWK